MAELITVAGVAITVPMVLSASWTVLKAAYSLHGSVDMRRKQIRLLFGSLPRYNREDLQTA